jgi:soluble lytic murein transglycosylase-like protein
MCKRVIAICTTIAIIFYCFDIPVSARTYVDDETPIEVQILCDIYGEKYNICPELLEAICYYESRYDATVIDGTGSCYGLMQIKKSCHKARMKRLGVTDLTDMESNIKVGADYLAELFEQYEDVGVVLTIYHGESNIENAYKGQLSSYVNKILEKSAYLERLHGK